MKPKFKILSSFIVLATIAQALPAKADPGTAIEICNEAGVCSVIAPEVGVVFTIISLLSDELQKDRPFGENNEIVRAINELAKFANEGMGPGNDLRKFLEISGIDRLLQNLGLKLFT